MTITAAQLARIVKACQPVYRKHGKRIVAVVNPPQPTRYGITPRARDERKDKFVRQA
ncbi:MAG TPA: hypothetical protein VMQ76_01175 [Terracidiphilus sp.]|nr:hypothetical protein [Terracidiphilus sp.]